MPFAVTLPPRYTEQGYQVEVSPVLLRIGFFACFYSISLKHSRFSRIAVFIFQARLVQEAVDISHRLPGSL